MRDQIRETDDLDLLLDSALATYADPGPGSGLEDRVLVAVAAAGAEIPVRTAPRRRRWLPWMIAIPVAAGLVLLWIVASTRVVHAPSTLPQQAYRSDQPQLPSVSGPSAARQWQRIQEMRPSGAKAQKDHAAVTARLKSCPDTKPDCGGVLRRALKSCPDTELASAGDSKRHAVSCTEAQPRALTASATADKLALPKLEVFPTPQPLTEQEQALLAFAQHAPAGKVAALSAVQAQDEESFSLAAAHIPLFEPPAEGKN